MNSKVECSRPHLGICAYSSRSRWNQVVVGIVVVVDQDEAVQREKHTHGGDYQVQSIFVVYLAYETAYEKGREIFLKDCLGRRSVNLVPREDVSCSKVTTRREIIQKKQLKKDKM